MNNQSIRYGEETTYTDMGDITMIEKAKIHDYKEVFMTKSYLKKFFTPTKRDAIAEMLNMIDKLEDENVTEISFTCEKKDKEKKYRVDMGWVVR